MARLIVNLVAPHAVYDTKWAQNTMPPIAVSVSRDDDGAPVNGLTTENFRVTLFRNGKFRDVKCWLTDEDEARWETADTERAGMYLLQLEWKSGEPMMSQTEYFIGLQVRTFKSVAKPGASIVKDMGQNVTLFHTPNYGRRTPS